jgi:subtilase family serine protease
MKLGVGILAAVAGALALSTAVQAQPVDTTSQIRGKINNADLVVLPRNTRPEATAANDLGAVVKTKTFGLQLLLQRSPAQEKAFSLAINQLHNPKSATFHQWMTMAQIGNKFGPSAADLNTVRNWLKAQGFKVTGTTPDHMFIAFNGTSASVQSAFHTSIHNVNSNGVRHFANMSNPSIPRALSSVVAGVVSMNDFRPHTNFSRRIKPNYTVADGCFPATPTGTHSASFTGHCFEVTPKDLQVIYNIKPQIDAGITGAGQTVVVLEDTNVYKTASWTVFRNVMGIPASAYGNPTFTQVHPSGSQACADPGIIFGDSGEAILDAEYASASAPGANIVLGSCSDTGTTNAGFGGLKALLNMLAQTNHPNIYSISYGECEVLNGATANAAYNTAYQTAAAEGASVYVSSGDESAVSCDANKANASHGIGVSGFQSSQYNISVGGTDFTENTDPSNANLWQTYWNDAGDLANVASAKSYIPEQPWNDSCASEIMASFYTGSSLTYGTAGFCNNSFGTAEFLSTGSGSGGPSGCATGAATTGSVVSGTCAGWPKPSYQSTSIQGVVNDGVRDTPDVSLFAANGVWGSYYPYCDLDPAGLGTSASQNAPGCSTEDPNNWAGAGGTSFSSPIWAGIQALINQKSGTTWGNSNTVFYALGAAEYGSAGNANCNSSLGTAASSTCVFHDVTAGDYNVNCKKATGSGGALHNCYLPSGTNGVGTTDLTNATYAPMYKSTSGWDFTTGLGTPDVNNLVNAFAALSIPSHVGKN